MACFLLLVLFAFLASSTSAAFNWNMGNLTLNHAQNTYCSPTTYQSRSYKGVLSGFVPTYTILDTSHDTHGYIGYHAGQQTIYVTFRGSESIKNWVSNLDAILTSYPAPGCSSCNVHKGFYDAEKAVFPNILAQVKALKTTYPSYQVVVTGHSLGAALATITALDLMNSGISNVKLFNYGSPRVGDTNFANYASSAMGDRNRVTHHKDMVVHCPMHERFTHISGEWYQSTDDVSVVACVGLEDKNCAYQWHITSIDDHLYYLGVHMGGGDKECAPYL